MMTPIEEKTDSEKPTELYREKDVLGLETPGSARTEPAPKPNRLFLGIGMVVLAIYLVYRIIRHFYG